MPILIDSEAKYASLIERLDKRITADITDGTAFLAQKIAEGAFKGRAPGLVTTLEENMKMREAVVRGLIDKLKASDKRTLTLEDYHRQVVLAFANATRDNDKYYGLFFERMRVQDLPDDLKAQAAREVEGSDQHASFMKLDKMPSAEEIQLIPLRAKAIEFTLNLGFEEFFKAATGKDDPGQHDPVLRAYWDEVNQLVHSGFSVRSKP